MKEHNIKGTVFIYNKALEDARIKYVVLHTQFHFISTGDTLIKYNIQHIIFHNISVADKLKLITVSQSTYTIYTYRYEI